MSKEQKKEVKAFEEKLKEKATIQMKDREKFVEKLKTLLIKTLQESKIHRQLDVDNWQETMNRIYKDIGTKSIVNYLKKQKKPIYRMLLKGDAELKVYSEEHPLVAKASIDFQKVLFGHISLKDLYIKVQEQITKENIEEYLSHNPNYARVYRSYKEQQDRLKAIKNSLPENYIDMYPCARSIKRHFIIHSGLTNSGKTYGAIQAFSKAERGVYLAPLRAIAYEIFDKTNMDGIACNLQTGEEEIEVPFAKHISGTVEMFSAEAYYDVAVIDECQMLEDKARGGAWTRAIMGVYAEEIHICTAPYAVELIKAIIEDCGDTYEVITHKRLTSLEEDPTNFQVPGSVRAGDALVLFSKKAVLRCASELKSHSINVSMLYGAMPFEVRRSEINKFMTGETNIIVTTDVIGMGVNLPIKRVIFLDTEKFDGIQERKLLPTEVQQIAGRAGRYGQYDVGYYGGYDKKYLKKCMEVDIEDIKTAYIILPKEMLSLDMPLSETLRLWSKMELKKFYERLDMSEKIVVCKRLELYTNDKEKIYNFLMLPFNAEDNMMVEMLVNLFIIEIQDIPTINKLEKISVFIAKYLEKVAHPDTRSDLHTAEHLYQILDVLSAYTNKFNYKDQQIKIVESKQKLNNIIEQLLANIKKHKNRCSQCRKVMPWDYVYPKCQKCYEENYFRYNDFYF